MILVSNRDILSGKSVEKCFGDTFNAMLDGPKAERGLAFAPHTGAYRIA